MRSALISKTRFWLPVALVGAFTVAASGLIWWQFERTHQLLREQLRVQAEQRSQQLADAMAGQISILIGNLDVALIQLREAWLANPAQIDSKARLVMGGLPTGLTTQIVVFDATGHALFSAPDSAPGFYAGDREHFKAHQAGGDRLIISRVFISRIDETWVVTLSRPVVRAGRFAGVVSIALQTDGLAARLASLQLAAQDSVALLHADGSFVARARGNTGVMGKHAPADRPFLTPEAPARGSYYRSVGSVDLTPRVYGWQRLAASGLVVVVGLAEAGFSAPLNALIDRDRRQQFGLTVLFLLGGGFVAYLMLRETRLQAQLATHLRRSAQRREVIDRIAALPAVAEGQIDTVFRLVTEEAAMLLGTARTSVWLLDEARSRLLCRDIFLASKGTHEEGMILEADTCRDQLAALKTDKYVATGDPCADPRTAAAADAYLRPLGISATLSAAIEASEDLQGMLCCEHIDLTHTWSGDEIAFVRQLTDQLALALQNEQRRQTQAVLQHQGNFQSLLLGISTAFINLPLDRYDEGVHDALAAIASFIGAERAFLTAYDFTTGMAFNTHQWCALECASAIASQPQIPLSADADWILPHTRGETLVVSDATICPSGTLRERLHAQGRRALVALPLIGAKGCRGCVGFDAVTRPLALADDDLRLLRLFAGLLVNLDHRRHAAELARAKDAAETANAAKSDFLSRMSHELRTPLNAILGFGQLLEMDKATLNETQADSVREILHAGEHLLAMVNEVLDLSRIESGRLNLSLESVAVLPVVAHCLAQVRPLASERGIVIAQALPGDVAVRADLIRLKQVLLNLLSNAIKYNRDGGRVAVSARPDGDRLRIAVSDSGRGIATEQLSRLFRPFERIESAYDGIEGTGIGLALVKKLVDAMGGEVGADSESGVGSTFWFTLPLAAPTGTGEALESRTRAEWTSVRDHHLPRRAEPQ